ncbi:hypothetical protein F3Y22_tig00113725pilonHSYRG00880 [Hibiscus syriacus]|uniref:non-specific serine/threonine protein kinase n=1 Tax=Hibiscus syriacus TaxID=106335 RepID=A0A6A2X3E4_HIBSY|nr:hypothetical protein F3Y22_tig00113725pilonHSYRG00880 [Hibiscus syriacus]
MKKVGTTEVPEQSIVEVKEETLPSWILQLVNQAAEEKDSPQSVKSEPIAVEQQNKNEGKKPCLITVLSEHEKYTFQPNEPRILSSKPMGFTGTLHLNQKLQEENVRGISSEVNVDSKGLFGSSGPILPCPKLELQMFDGSNPRGWVRKCQKYFNLLGVPEEQKLDVAAMYLMGKAETWFDGYIIQKHRVTWHEFEADLCHRFCDRNYSDIIEEFNKLMQKGSVEEYQEKFELRPYLLQHHMYLGEDYFVSSFISGLKEELKHKVKVLEPRNLSEAYRQSKLYELANEIEGKKSNFSQKRFPYTPAMDWMKEFIPIMMDFKAKTISFEKDGQIVIIRGTHKLPLLKPISGEKIQKLVAKYTEVNGEIYLLNAEVEENIIPLPLQDLLEEFKEVFVEPEGMSPSRKHDHAIVLKQGTQPVNLRPYRFAHHHKTEVEKQIAHMLSSSIIQERKNKQVADALSRQQMDYGEFLQMGVTVIVPTWMQDFEQSYEGDLLAQEKLHILIIQPDKSKEWKRSKGVIYFKDRIYMGNKGDLRQKIIVAFHDSPQGELLQPILIPHNAWEVITMDFIEGLPPSAKHNCIMVYKLHGPPKVAISDRDKSFTSLFWQELLKQLGITTLFCTAYHPETDGQTERLNQCLEQYLRRSFGSVYKGILEESGIAIEVKVFTLLNRGSSKSFLDESLVYEFMVNGSLEEWLHPSIDVNESNTMRNMSFFQRVNVIIDVAHAPEYLHHHCEQSIIHYDLKPSNVLLDEEIVGHLNDFGLEKNLSAEGPNYYIKQSSSVGLRGTISYAPPEYGMRGKLSTKGDVYDYGFLLLEMVTAKKLTHDIFKEGFNIHNFVAVVLPDRVTEIIDPNLLQERAIQERSFIVQLAYIMSAKLLCATQSAGTLNARLLELTDVLSNRKINFACIQETRWKGARARECNGYKLWYSGIDNARNGMGYYRSGSGKCPFSVCPTRWPRGGGKRCFWVSLDNILRSIPEDQRVFIGGDFNSHIGSEIDGYDSVHGGFSFGSRNEEGRTLLEFATAHDMAVTNSFFNKRYVNLIMFYSRGHCTQIDYILVRNRDRWACIDCKVFPEEACASQNRLLVLVFRVRNEGSTHRRSKLGKPRILWKNLHGVKAYDFRSKVLSLTGFRTTNSNNAYMLWKNIANSIREVGKNILGLSIGKVKKHKESWWWNDEVQTKVKTKQTFFKALLQCNYDEERSRAKQRYKEAKRVAKKTVAKEKIKAYEEIEVTLIGTEEVKMALRKMGRDKAVSPNQIPITVWLTLGEEGVKWLTNIFNIILETAKMPEEWRESTLWEMVIEARFRQVTRVLENQFGFMPGRSTMEAIHLLRRLMEKYREKIEIFTWRSLTLRRRMIVYLSTTYFRTTVGDTEAFPVEIGLHQGSALSPYIVALIMDDIYCATPDSVPWCMLFADDIVLVAKTKNELNSRLATWKIALEEKGLRINIEKKEYLCLNFSGNQNNEDVEVCIEGNVLPSKDCFKYLGSMIHKDGVLMMTLHTNGNKTSVAVWIQILFYQEGSRKEDGGRRNENASMDMWRVGSITVDDARRRGRPKGKWVDRVRSDLKDLALTEDMTSDRKVWRLKTRVVE